MTAVLVHRSRSTARRVLAVPPALLGLIAVVIAGIDVDRPAVWRDEAASITMAQRDWPAFWATVAHVDAVHALYYAGLHLWFSIVPYSPLTLRLPSVLAAGGTAVLLTVLGTRLVGIRGGVAAGAAGAVLPSLVWAGGEGRSFACTALLATGATLALLRALDETGSRRRAAWAWVGYAALLALTAAVFVEAALLAAAHLVTVLLIGRGKRVAGIGSLVAAMVVVSPLLVVAVAQGGQIGWIVVFGSPPLWPDGVQQQWFRSDPVLIAWGVVLLIGLAGAAVRRRVPRRALALTVPWAVLPPVGLVAVALVHAPVYWPRYATFTAPAVALLLGVLIAALPAPLTAVALLVVAAVAVPQIRADREPRAKADSEMQLAADLVAASRTSADGPSGIVFGQYGDVPLMTTRVEEIAYPAAFRGLVDLTARVPLPRSAELFGEDLPTDDAVPRMAGLRTVWILLDLDSVPKTQVPAAGMRALGFHEAERLRTPGSLLLRWTR